MMIDNYGKCFMYFIILNIDKNEKYLVKKIENERI